MKEKVTWLSVLGHTSSWKGKQATEFQGADHIPFTFKSRAKWINVCVPVLSLPSTFYAV